MQTATSETESKSHDLSICVHHYTLRAPCPKGQGIADRICGSWHTELAHQIFPETFNARQLDLVGTGRASSRLDTSPSSGTKLDERWRGRGLEGWTPEAVLSLIDRARHRLQTIPRPSSSTRPLWGSTSRHMIRLLARAFAGVGQKLKQSDGLRYAAVRGARPRGPPRLALPPPRAAPPRRHRSPPRQPFLPPTAATVCSTCFRASCVPVPPGSPPPPPPTRPGPAVPSHPTALQ